MSIDFKCKSVTEIYGENCFNERTIRKRVPKSIFKEFMKVQRGETELTLEVAEVIANAMKDWAIEKGATHYTHWFQPLTGLTAEKHDSFISASVAGEAIMEFSGKELIKGEPDASSFPNGGLRSTFEARGYTAWDTTSPAFLREDNAGTTLYIPTAFVSYRGEALDKKVPLLRSMVSIEKEALRVLKALGDDKAKRVSVTVGIEQEYFLIEKEFYQKRLDLQHTGRTLLGAASAKDQELTGHYFGTIKERVAKFMRELDIELWKIGVTSKTKHNEVAPNQFELAAIFNTANVATDNNQAAMDIIQKLAVRHGLVALLHEKPFAGVNGSGKHNNWSLATDKGVNLLEPGENPKENAQFLVFLTAVIEAVDKYAPLLRLSAASANNDHRLGGHEAPPAIISIFLGDQLTNILGNIDGTEGDASLEIGVDSLPKLPKDMTDRNRTSPFAFTGNKFEFRMVGSSASTSNPNVILNTIVAEILSEYAIKLEESDNVNETIKEIIQNAYEKHGRIIFNGNGYGEEWVEEAKSRGLVNLKATDDVLDYYLEDTTINLFEKHCVLNRGELESRYQIYAEKYINQLTLEGRVLVKMIEREVVPSVNKEIESLANVINSASKLLSEELLKPQKTKLEDLANKLLILIEKIEKLKEYTEKSDFISVQDHVKFSREKIFFALAEIRKISDELELEMPAKAWPLPTYEEMLYHL